MTNDKDAAVRTCQDLGSEDQLPPDIYSESVHEFEISNRHSIAERSSCEVLVIEEECSLCGTGKADLLVTGDAPRKMREYKRLIYDVYETFYAQPQSYGQTGFAGPVRQESVSMHLEMKSTFEEVTNMACNDAEREAEKQSAKAIWRQMLGPEHASDD